jgi:hypothetical protein
MRSFVRRRSDFAAAVKIGLHGGFRYHHARLINVRVQTLSASLCGTLIANMNPMKLVESIDIESPSGILRALAIATTEYYEASPDRTEKARLQYEEVLARFNSSQQSAMPLVPLNVRTLTPSNVSD